MKKSSIEELPGTAHVDYCKMFKVMCLCMERLWTDFESEVSVEDMEPNDDHALPSVLFNHALKIFSCFNKCDGVSMFPSTRQQIISITLRVRR
jgi:hypothetical protein